MNRTLCSIVALSLLFACGTSVGKSSDDRSHNDDKSDTRSPTTQRSSPTATDDEDDGFGGGDSGSARICTPQYATSSAQQCNDAFGCKVTVALSGGATFCTVECSDDSTCEAIDPQLTCDSNECKPKCTQDAECTEKGWTRCEVYMGGACDNI